ncbi:hypothetical protein [Streptomyces sp.]|uniref:hypothetical protein n=1 Tax=Streptomyces sp. TaxID=1931 RepID=UPI002D7A0927|nr:hypothetical protein [Streptomyces sp.]HET6359713.1 hypothetical protein [Streptomyces sp.]
MTDPMEAVNAAMEAEFRLLDPAVRLSPTRMAAETGAHRAHRSSLWRLTDEGRLLYFHQRTRCGGDGAPSDLPR